MSDLQWSDQPSHTSHSAHHAPHHAPSAPSWQESFDDPWFGIAMALAGVVLGYLIGVTM